MAHIDAIRIAGHDYPQRPTMAQCRSFHCLLPSSISCILHRASRFTRPTVARWKVETKPAAQSHCW
jgi:hypothetical protein